MRSFIVLCLVAVVCADKLGYNYQPVAHASAELSFQPGLLGNSALSSPASSAALAPASYAAPAPASYAAPAQASYAAPAQASYAAPAQASYAAPAQASYAAPAQASYAAPAPASYGAPAQASYAAPAPASYAAPALASYGAPESASNAAQGALAPAASVEYEKEFYTFSGPEQQNDDSAALRPQLESNLKKHLRVIFIKNPENTGLENAALSLAQHATEQKTAIYVLNKQADLSNLANKLNSAGNNKYSKPEVHFVKYRTQEDAANAQLAIQAQYNQLGGNTHSHNGEVAPLLNFASPAAGAGAVRNAEAQAPQNAYLPAAVFRY